LANRDSKLARLAQERREKNKTGAYENQVTTEDRLARLEEDIRRLKVEFDVFFNGGSKRPPYDTKLRVESHLKQMGDDRTLNFAQRYHYNSLATRYASFRAMWRRSLAHPVARQRRHSRVQFFRARIFVTMFRR